MLEVQEEPLDLSVSGTNSTASCSQTTVNQTEGLDMAAAQLQLQTAFLEVYSMMLAENFLGLMDPNATIHADQNCSDTSQRTDETPQESTQKEEIRKTVIKLNKSSSGKSKKYKKALAPEETILEEMKADAHINAKKRYRFCLNVKRFEANARERNRVQQLSNMFENLRLCLPLQNEIKISKLSTLKVASAYIGFLRSLLSEEESQIDDCSELLNFELESAKTLKKL